LPTRWDQRAVDSPLGRTEAARPGVGPRKMVAGLPGHHVFEAPPISSRGGSLDAREGRSSHDWAAHAESPKEHHLSWSPYFVRGNSAGTAPTHPQRASCSLDNWPPGQFPQLP
jgi:hypothetical protein